MFVSQFECFTMLIDIAVGYCVHLTNDTVCQYSRLRKGLLILRSVMGQEHVGTAFPHLLFPHLVQVLL